MAGLGDQVVKKKIFREKKLAFAMSKTHYDSVIGWPNSINKNVFMHF